jgi:site-specific DNA recombinase
VWQEMVRLLEDPTLMQGEIERRLQAARNADPQQQREEVLRRERARLQSSMDRLLTAYQEGLVSLEELRSRMPELRRQQQALHCELQSLQMATQDQSRYLHLVQNLDHFRDRLRAQAEKLDMVERQKILRLLVKEVVVGIDSITIRHCIPLPHSAPTPPEMTPPPRASGQNYLLRTGGSNSPRADGSQPPPAAPD